MVVGGRRWVELWHTFRNNFCRWLSLIWSTFFYETLLKMTDARDHNSRRVNILFGAPFSKFNHNIEKWSHARESGGWNYLSTAKLERLHGWSFGMDNLLHPTLYNVCNYLSVFGLKLIHVSERVHWYAPPSINHAIVWNDFIIKSIIF